MAISLNEEFIYLILSIVEEIPIGKVATYGQIARLSGYGKNARLIGKILSLSEYYGRFPCHRVVNSNGRCAPGWEEQKDILLKEGITFKKNGFVNLKNHQWELGLKTTT